MRAGERGLSHIQLAEQLLSLAGGVGTADAEHSVHAVVAEGAPLGLVGHQIIVFLIPGQRPGADGVESPLVAEVLLLICAPVVVLELNLPPLQHGLMVTEQLNMGRKHADLILYGFHILTFCSF